MKNLILNDLQLASPSMVTLELLCSLLKVSVSPKKALIIAIDQYSPVFTAGGSKEAEIATPTMDPEFPPRTERATPTPLGIAIATPTSKPEVSVREDISLVGQSTSIVSKFPLLEFNKKLNLKQPPLLLPV